MAKSKVVELYKTLSGALTKINKKSQHAEDQRMILATHRVAETTSQNCNRVYIRTIDNVTRKTPYSTEERARQLRFKSVAQAVAARRNDLSKMTQDQEAFKAQKDLPNGKKTMRSYLWSLELAAYDEAHQG